MCIGRRQMRKRKEKQNKTDDENVNMCFYETKYRKALWLPAQGIVVEVKSRFFLRQTDRQTDRLYLYQDEQ